MLAHLRLGSLVRFYKKIAQPMRTYALLASEVTLISAYLSDRYESRGMAVALVSLLAVVGYALYLGNILCASR